MKAHVEKANQLQNKTLTFVLHTGAVTSTCINHSFSYCGSHEFQLKSSILALTGNRSIIVLNVNRVRQNAS